MESRYLCRAKRTDNGEWVEGFYFCMTHPDGRHTHHFIIPLGADLSLGTPIEKIQVEVDPSTICQCTGLYDKNDKLIWENDIVRDKYRLYKVVYENEEASWMLVSISGAIYGIGSINSAKYETIGNVVDNPELLEVQDGEINRKI